MHVIAAVPPNHVAAPEITPANGRSAATAKLPPRSASPRETNQPSRAKHNNADVNQMIRDGASKLAKSGELPEDYYRADEMRRVGMPRKEIAEQFSVSRSTIWRWLTSVDNAAAEQLRETRSLAMVAEITSGLEDLEATTRRDLTQEEDPRQRRLLAAEARRTLQARANLLIKIGILKMTPEEAHEPNSFSMQKMAQRLLADLE